MKFIAVYKIVCNEKCQYYAEDTSLKREIDFELENNRDLMTKTYDIIKAQMPSECEEHFKIIGVLRKEN